MAVQDEAAGEVLETGAEGHAPITWLHHRVPPDRLRDRLAIDLGELEGVGVDVKDVIAGIVVDDRPFFDGAEDDPLVDPVMIEDVTVDEKGELLVVGGRRILRLP